MKYDVLTIGDAFEDVFVEPEMDIHYDRTFASGKGIAFEFGEKIPLKSVQYEVGGSACNIAVGLSRLGLKTALATTLGDDSPKTKVIDKLIDEDVDTNQILISSKNQTGFSVIFSIDGERTVFVYHGLRDYSELKIKKGVHANWLFMTSLGDNTDDVEKRVVEEVAEHGAKFAWNPGSKQIAKGANHYRHLLHCTSILFLNREEAIKFLNFPIRPQIEEAAKGLQRLGVKIVVITNGKEGATVYDGTDFYHKVPDLHIKKVDSTGAGDAFATGFLGRVIISDEDISAKIIEESLDWGIANSGSVIQYIGAQKGLLSRDEIIKE
ncbi:MAG: carbohydrate kinase family protein [Candidatus Berkelbacteria bacterium]|nr:carbohydrate kinase family protein [Candidatus Berkelbacteria bacterium]